MPRTISNEALRRYGAEAKALASEARKDGKVELAREYGRIAETLDARAGRVAEGNEHP